MRRIGAWCGIAGLIAVIFVASPAAAFGFRIGPFHFGFPFFGHRHHHHLYMHGNPREVSPRDVSSGDVAPAEGRRSITSALLYPQLALPAMYDGVFSPAFGSSWPFDYQAIFSTAFARASRRQNPHLCEPQPDLANGIVGRLSAALGITAEQQEPLQRLGGALGAASGYLAKACPDEIPLQPVARLQLMQSQIEQLATALDFIRQPLQVFIKSLNDEQRARLAAMIAVPDAADNGANKIAAACGKSSGAIDWSMAEIEHSVRPTDAQREAVADVRQAFEKAASDLDAHCPKSAPLTAPGRLEAIEGRLDSTWRAILSIQVALAGFETKLSDEQKGRFNTMNFAAR
jgi:hypothetical protein